MADGLTGSGITGGDLGEVSEVISLHLQVEDLALGLAGFGDQVLVQEVLKRHTIQALMMPICIHLRGFFSYEDVLADVPELSLDLLPVLLGHALLLLGVGVLLLDGGDDPPARPPSAHDVLVGHGEQVPLLVGELLAGLGDGLHGRGHVVVALGLLGQLGALDTVFLVGHLDWCLRRVTLAVGRRKAKN